MNYCSLQDAWGKPNYISENFKKWNGPYIPDCPKPGSNSIDIIENFEYEAQSKETNDEITKCDRFINHMSSCPTCRGKVQNYLKPASTKLVEKFTDLVETNKDTVVLLLFGIFILLFFHLLSSINERHKYI